MSAMSSYASTPKKRKMARTWSSVVDQIPSEMKRDMDIVPILEKDFGDLDVFNDIPRSWQNIGLCNTFGDDSPLVQKIIDLLDTPQVVSIRVVMPMICQYIYDFSATFSSINFICPPVG